MARHLKCVDCGKNKPVKEFYQDKKTSTGYKFYCKECAPKRASRYDNTDLGILLTLPQRVSTKTWTMHEAKKMMKVYVKLRGQRLGRVEALKGACVGDRKPMSVHLMISELTKAARNGMTLEQYFEAGRPFRYGVPKVLVKK